MPLKQSLKQCLGRIAATLRPSLATAVSEGAPAALKTRLGQWIHLAQTQQAAQEKAWPALRQQLAGYWKGGEGDQFYDAYPERFEQWFLKDHYPLVEALVAQAQILPMTQLVEVGCGDGRVLEHLAQRLPQLASLTGLDINPGIIARNQQSYAAHPRLKFESGDAQAWLLAHLSPNTILLTYGGVWEYFTQAELAQIFTHFRQLGAPSLIALVEPLGADFDVAQETQSRPYGLECSFSHPHRFLLETAGFEIVFDQEVILDHRWKMLIARGG